MESTEPEQATETLLGAWRRIRRIRLREMAEALKVRTQTAQRYCTLPTDPNHCRPGREASDRLRAWTRGALHAGNYADPWDGVSPLPPAPVSQPECVPEDIQ